MLNNETYGADDESAHSSSTYVHDEKQTTSEQVHVIDGDLGDFLNPDLTLACQTIKDNPKNVHTRPTTSKVPKTDNNNDEDCLQCNKTSEPFCHVNLDQILKLKESTKKLLCVLDQIQSKTRTKNINLKKINVHLNQYLKPIPTRKDASVTELLNCSALKKLEGQARKINSIYVKDDEIDDCSVYKRLTRKCNCLNYYKYNDFIIHFNEDTKYRTSIIGEIIKNMRILKKFLYLNGNYTRNALLFLNEGLANSTHTEKVEIIQGCAHADMCNIFEENSIVINYILWPCKNEIYGDSFTQELTANFLNKLAQFEEGRRYLNFSSKIINDIKQVLKRKMSLLEFKIVESLNATLNLLSPPLTQNFNATYYCKPVDEGMGKKTVNTLIDYRQYMTLEEVVAHLDLLQTLSAREKSKNDLVSHLPSLLLLFKQLLVEYNNSEMNIILTNILNNVITMSEEKEEPDTPKTLIIADVGTEPIQMKDGTSQHPPKKASGKKINKLQLNRNTKHKDDRNNSRVGFFNRSQKFSKELRSSIIVVPVED